MNWTTQCMRRHGVWATLLVLPLLGACYEHTVTTGAGAPRGPVVYDHWENYWLGGLIGHTRTDVEEICPSGDATIESKQTFLNGLVSALTSGIYSPVTVKVRCRGGRRAELDLSQADVARIVEDERFRDWVAAELPERLSEVDQAVADR